MKRISDMLYGNHNPYLGLPEILPFDGQGWSSTSPCFEESIIELQPKLIVEVGTWKGASAIHIAETCMKYYTDFEIVCIDTFLGSVEHWSRHSDHLPQFKNGRPIIYDQFLSNVINRGLTQYITPFPIDSINGGMTLEHFDISPDLIYIDAGHEYESVKADLDLYKNIVRRGGHLIGDDWFYRPIKTAVANSLGEVITKSPDKFLWVRPEL
jgi:hypothetical protein